MRDEKHPGIYSGHIKLCIMKVAYKILTYSLITSRLKYGVVLLCGLPNTLIAKPQGWCSHPDHICICGICVLSKLHFSNMSRVWPLPRLDNSATQLNNNNNQRLITWVTLYFLRISEMYIKHEYWWIIMELL